MIHGEKCGLGGQWLRSGPDRAACREDRDGPVAFRARCRGHAGTAALAAAADSPRRAAGRQRDSSIGAAATPCSM